MMSRFGEHLNFCRIFRLQDCKQIQIAKTNAVYMSHRQHFLILKNLTRILRGFLQICSVTELLALSTVELAIICYENLVSNE